MRNIADFHIVLGFILIVALPPCVSAESRASSSESTSNQAVRELAGTASRPYAIVVDANTLEDPKWGQVVEALKKKYNAKVFVAHYPELSTVRKALNEYMPWYVCFVAQPEQATREMITATAHTMTWLDDDPYEDAIWAVLTGVVAEDALRIINAEPLLLRKMLTAWGRIDWFEEGVKLNRYSGISQKFVKNSDGIKQKVECPEEILPEFVEVLNQDDCDIIMTSGHATEHAFYFGYPDTTTGGYITHNAKGDIYGVDTLGKVHPVNTKQLKVYYAWGNCLIGHIDRKSCLSLAWIHNGVDAFFGHLYNQNSDCYASSIAEHFMALQGRYTFAEATYANWLALRFSVNEQLELHPCCEEGGKGTVLYGDPAWEARVKHTTVPSYTQDLNIEHLSDGLIKMTVSITVSQKLNTWIPAVRPVVLLPFRIQEAQVKHTDLDKMDVADNFIVLDLGTKSIGGSDLPVGTKKSVVLHARKLEVWPFLSDDEVVTRIREQKLDNVSRCFDLLTDETVDPNERIKKAAEWGLPSILAKEADVNAKDEDGRTPLHLAVESANRDIIQLLLDKGADINAKDEKSGSTALHYAVRFSKRETAELLIARGADINARDKQGHTPLYVAANHDYKITEFLLSEGADSSIRIESGQTLLKLAQQRKQIESTVPDMIFDGTPNSRFGHKIAFGDVDGDGYDDILIDGGGRVCLFYGGPDMDATADLIFEGQNEGDWFGDVTCGDIDNDGHEDILVGAGHYNNQQGRAYLYWGSDRKSMDTHPDKIFTGEVGVRSEFGLGWPTVYDIDNDGYDDILLGALQAGNSKGRAYLYYGNKKDLMDTSPDLIFTGENTGDELGLIVSCGDVDNDGHGDIVIGCHYRTGLTYLYYGDSKLNMNGKADVIFKEEPKAKASSGLYGIAFIDQNRDGYDDVVLGFPGYNDKQGRVYLFYGNSKRSLDVDPDMVFGGEDERSDYGRQIVCGDLDGDNVDDLVIGANDYRQRTGRVYVYWGNELSGQDHDPKPGRIFTGENPYDNYSWGMACGDVNNDGFDDLVIGAYGYKAGKGRAYLYYGGPRNK